MRTNIHPRLLVFLAATVCALMALAQRWLAPRPTLTDTVIYHMVMNPGQANAQTDTVLTDIHIVDDLDPDTTQVPPDPDFDYDVVGNIPYDIDVSPSGQPTVTVPITCFALDGEYAPSVSLSYGGMASPLSVMGSCWTLNAASVITRATGNWFTDGNVGGVTRTEDDAFTLDGVRLVAQGAASGGVCWYRTQTGDTRVRRDITSDSFRVLHPDGTTSEYTVTDDINYYVTSTSRLDGTAITYTYAPRGDGCGKLLTRISYGKERTVGFKYKSTSLKRDFYCGGQRFCLGELLDSVTVSKGQTTLSRWHVGYDYLDASARVRKITCGDASGNMMRPLKFAYGGNNGQQEAVSTDSLTLAKCLWAEHPEDIIVTRGKFNYGSELDGFMMYPNKWPYYIHNDNKQINSQYADNDTIVVTTGMQNPAMISCTTMLTGNSFVDILAMDVDGKRGDELVKINNRWFDDDVTIFTTMRIGSEGGLVPTDTLQISMPLIKKGNHKSVRPKSFFSGDFDGDGREEILMATHTEPFPQTMVSPAYGYQPELRLIAPETGQVKGVFQIDSCRVFIPNQKPGQDYLGHRIMPVDYNGDGKLDLAILTFDTLHIFSFSYDTSRNLCMTTVSSKFPYNIQQIQCFSLVPGDYNGDGVTDFMLTTATDNATLQGGKLIVGDGAGHYGATSEGSVYTSGNRNCFAANIDGNECSDLVVIDTAGGNLTVASDPSGGVYKRIEASIPADCMVVPAGISFQYGNSSIYAINRNGGVNVVRLNRMADEARLLAWVSDGLGNEHRFGFKRYSWAGVIGIPANPYTFPYSYYAEGMPVCAWHRHAVGADTLQATQYTYTNPAVHLQGLGFCGFSHVRADDSVTGHHVWTEYDPMKFATPLSRQTLKTSETFSYDTIVDNTRHISMRLLTTTGTSLATGETVTVTNTYDTRDNVISSVTMYSDGGSVGTSVTYANTVADDHVYLPSLVTAQTETTTVGNATSQHGRLVTYDATTHLPVTETEFHGSSDNAVKTLRYTRDTGGRVTKSETRPYSGAWRQRTLTYGSLRAPSVVRDELGRKWHYSYGAYGVTARTLEHAPDITPATGLDGGLEVNGGGIPGGGTPGGGFDPTPGLNETADITTSYHYDSFGRVDSITSPYGTGTRITRSWADANDFKAVYLVETVEDGHPARREYFDAQGRRVRVSTRRYNGNWLSVDSVYDVRGRLLKASLPNVTNGRQWVEMEYDNYDRLIGTTYPDGHTDTYSYQGLTSTSTIDGVTSTRTTDPRGRLVAANDAGGTITYDLRPDGQPTAITVGGSAVTTFEYDTYGRRTAINDPSAGRRETQYDTSGNVCRETDARGRWTAMTFNNVGLLKTRSTSDGLATTLTYDNCGNLVSEVGNNGTTRTITYDDLLRKSSEDVDGFKKTYSYSGTRIASVGYSMGNDHICTENYAYDYGNLSQVTLDNGKTAWRLQSENIHGLPAVCVSGSIYTSLTYDLRGNITGRTLRYGPRHTLHTASYSYDPYTGNMTARATPSISEQFSYDGLNRLTSDGVRDFSYDNLGNLTEKDGAGTISYDTQHPYAAVGLLPETGFSPMRDQTVVFNAMQLPDTISEAGLMAVFTYRGDESRAAMTITRNDTLYRFVNYYDELTVCGRMGDGQLLTKSVLWIGGTAYNAPAAMVRDYGSSVWRLCHVARDPLGSVTHVLDSVGGIIQELSYDAWGRLRDPVTGAVYAAGSEPEPYLLWRGFTGHEHLPEFGLVNMNARLYDPAVGRFLSPDPAVQLPDNTQGYNRYSYCLNNPLRYNDENGEFFLGLFFGFFRGLFKGENPFKSAWKTAVNEVKIFFGLFKADWSRGFGKGLWQIFSRLTFELPQTAIGYAFSVSRNWVQDLRVASYRGATYLIGQDNRSFRGITMGSYINVWDTDVNIAFINGYFDPTVNQNYMHEYGHYLQSQKVVLAYLFVVGVPSLVSAMGNANKHKTHWMEKDASTRAAAFFDAFEDNAWTKSNRFYYEEHPIYAGLYEKLLLKYRHHE